MKAFKLTIFQKILISIILFLIPVILLFAYSYSVSVSVVQKEIYDSIQQRLSFLQNRLDIQLNHIAKGAFQLCNDPALNEFANNKGFENYYDVIEFKKQLIAKITVQSTTLDWPVVISVFFPKIQQVISTDSLTEYDGSYLAKYVSNTWQSRKVTDNGNAHNKFYFYAVSPFTDYTSTQKADQIVEICYSDKSLVDMLDNYKDSGKGDPFVYNRQNGVISNSSANKELVGHVVEQLDDRQLSGNDSFQAAINGSSYLIYCIKSTAFDWVLVDYVPVQQVLMPIEKSRDLFYISLLLLLAMSIIAAFMLYRGVQIPVGKLVKGLQSVKLGKLSTRIEKTGGREFEFVFMRFNEMAEQIQQLIENVYMEQLAVRDARLKQLQSQINPHFLYNCLFFICNMARLGRDEAIEKMAMNMGEYYRYTTRLEKDDTTVEDEIKFIVSYLEIQKLRMKRVNYSINILDDVLRLEIPRLLLQPVVENAVIHGVEPKVNGGTIFISGSIRDNIAELTVMDDGVGVQPEKLDELMRQLKMPVQPGAGYGIWNVNQRLMLRFGEDSGVRYSLSDQGGLIVSLIWNTEGKTI